MEAEVGSFQINKRDNPRISVTWVAWPRRHVDSILEHLGLSCYSDPESSFLLMML